MTPPAPRILIAGVGNVFLGDDAFGSETARRLAGRPWPDAVRVVDFGIRGVDLIYALMDCCECTIILDAAPRGGAPGSLYLIEPEFPHHGEPSRAAVSLDGHSLHFEQAARVAWETGGRLGRILLVGCEPATRTDPDEYSMELSPPVRAAVEQAATLVESLVGRLLNGTAENSPSAFGTASRHA